MVCSTKSLGTAKKLFYTMENTNNIFTINSRKFDGRIHKSWNAEMIQENDALLVFKGVFEKEVNHKFLGVIRRGTVSYEYYWTNRWYNVFRFHEPEGNFRNFYCNVNQPPTLTEKTLDYIDLDIDVLIWRDWQYQILDLEEFAENADKFNYSRQLINKVDESLLEILSLSKDKVFPFDTEI